MTTRTTAAQRAPRRRRDSRDVGVTLVEILIAIVLIGGVIAGTMVSLRATVIAGTIHRDHSNAHGWMQSASDVLYAAPKIACDSSLPSNGEPDVRAAYEAVVDGVANPQGWNDWQIRIVGPIQFWNSGNTDADPDIEFFFGSDCDPSLTLQLIRIEVRSTDNRIIESVEIIK